MTITEDEVIKEVKKRIKEFPDDRLYYTLRKMKCRYFERSLRHVKCIMAFQTLGFPKVSIRMVSSVLGTNEESVRNVLHNLGDKDILQIEMMESDSFLYKLHPKFMESYGRHTDESMV